MLDTDSIHTVAFHHPEGNFTKPGNLRRMPEADFSKQFAETYKEQFPRIHSASLSTKTLFVRELPVAGNGIADLVVMSWRPSQKLPEKNDHINNCDLPTLRAFEIKLKDWRSGLMQAHRYKYFSDVSILVLPMNKLPLAKSKLDLFQKLGIGLWGFNPTSNVITKVFTPRPKRQHSSKHNANALMTAFQTALI